MDSTQRFSDRVDDYVRFRPRYPVEVLSVLKSECGLQPSDVVVDVGSGTGISAELFLQNGNVVYGVEPNAPMRKAAESTLNRYDRFRSVNGTSEATTLPSKCADFIVAAQAFHWFSPQPTKKEFQRILRDDGYAVVLFNDRKTTGSPFAVQYENLLNEFGTDYQEVNHKNVDDQRYRDFFGSYRKFDFPNHQDFDFEGLLGRVRSSSYMPKEGEPQFSTMLKKLEDIFAQNQKNGRVVMEYTTQMFCSQLNG